MNQCTSDACRQGRLPCPTPEACSDTVVTERFKRTLDEAFGRRHFDPTEWPDPQGIPWLKTSILFAVVMFALALVSVSILVP